MNLRNVLRAYSLLRQLSDDEAALLETLRAANDNERQLIAEAMGSKPPQKKAGKKSAGGGGRSVAFANIKCAEVLADGSVCGKSFGAHSGYPNSGHQFKEPTGRSKRGESLKQQISSSGIRRPSTTTTDDDSDGFCRHRFNEGKGHVCGVQQDHNIHHLENMVDYHPFVAADQPPTTTGKPDARGAAGGGD